MGHLVIVRKAAFREDCCLCQLVSLSCGDHTHRSLKRNGDRDVFGTEG